VRELSLSQLPPEGPALIELLSAARDDGARVVLFNATGALPEPPRLDARTLRALVLSELPLVFAFEGELSGPATDLALAADIRLCAEGASLRGPLAANARVRTLVDEAMAMDLFFGRTVLDAGRLLASGLVSAVTAAGGALAEGRRVAAVVASRGPIATQLAKEAIWRGLALPLEQALRFETDLTLLLQTTKDRAEGVRAFLEKRPPTFTGE